MEIGLPHVRTLVVVEKTSTSKNAKKPPSTPPKSAVPDALPSAAAQEVQKSVSYYLSCHHPRAAEFFAELIRGHWGGCEIRNHWVRDALFEEDSTRSKNILLNGNLAVLRASLIALKSVLAPAVSWPSIRELSSMKISLPYNMICKNLFK